MDQVVENSARLFGADQASVVLPDDIGTFILGSINAHVHAFNNVHVH